MNGWWFVLEINGVETSEVLIPYGINHRGDDVELLVTTVGNPDTSIDLRKYNNQQWELQGNGSGTIPANVVVKVYASVV